MDATASAKKANKPVKVFSFQDVAVSVFANEHVVEGKKATFYNLAATKSYRKGGKYMRTHSFAATDVSNLCFAFQQAAEYVRNLQFLNPEAGK